MNQFFYSEHICQVGGDPSVDVKDGCREAYILSAILTGISETVALLAAPIWGYTCDRIGKTKSLGISALIGIVGFSCFGGMQDPRGWTAYIWASLIGVSQIGAIVCSLSLCTEEKTEYSGSIAGVYSVTGAAGILLLTKLGGYSSDKSRGAPFTLMAIFNGILLLSSIGVLVMFEGKLISFSIPFVGKVDIGRGLKMSGRDVLRVNTPYNTERDTLGERMSYAQNNGDLPEQDSDN